METMIIHISIILIIFIQSSQQSCVSADIADYTDCGGILIGNEGVVKRPSQNYRKSAYCKWTITQDEGFGFKIKVKNMKLEDSVDRCKDNLMIESEQINNKERKILCGYDDDSEASEHQQDEEENFFIPTRQINVTFCSSVLPEDKIETDFQLKWSVVTTVEEPATVAEENEPIPFFIEEFRAPPAQERRMQCRQGMCHENAVCRETMFGRAKCMCRPGYMGDGKLSCLDINECHESQASSSSTCHPNASCINLPGSFTCHCPLGFSGDGQTCTEKPHGALQSDGCRFDSCRAESDCIASDEGGHYCICKDGFTGNGDNCRDIDECTENESLCNGFRSTCENTIGSYICHHPSQYFPIVTERQQQPQQNARSDYVRMIQRLREMFQGEATTATTEAAATATTIRPPQIVRRLSILERIRARVVVTREGGTSSSTMSSSSTKIVTDSPPPSSSSLFESAAETTTAKSSSSGGNALITRSRLLVALQTAMVTVAMAMFD